MEQTLFPSQTNKLTNLDPKEFLRNQQFWVADYLE